MLARAATWMLLIVIGPVRAASGPANILREQDPARLESAAIVIAAAGDPANLAVLSARLGERAFLRRLDPPVGAEVPVVRLRNVFRALAEHPSAATAALCISLARNPSFTALPARLNLLLNALAAVRPMSQAAADVFRSTNSEGFIEVNGPLLAKNATPRALEVLAQILSDDGWNVAQRVSIAHWSLLPMRADLGIVRMSTDVLQNEALSSDVRIAILESLYDSQPALWFGRVQAPPSAPSWNSASNATRAALQSLGKRMLSRSDLPIGLRTAILKTLAELSSMTSAARIHNFIITS